MKNTKEFTIWEDTYFMSLDDLEEWAQDINAQRADFDEEPLTDYKMHEEIEYVNSTYLDDERAVLERIALPEDILCIADLGLWNGRASGYRIIDKFVDIFDLSADFCRWFVDLWGNVRAQGVHHDGSNSYLFRMWMPGTSDEARENLLDKIYMGEATEKDISRLTVRLGDYFGKEYGWKFAGRKPACAA